MNYQPGIIQPIPTDASYLFLVPIDGADHLSSLHRLAEQIDGDTIVVGLGYSLVSRFGAVHGLSSFPRFDQSQIMIPVTNDALLCWIRGTDPGQVYHRAREIKTLLSDSFSVRSEVPAFRYAEGRDLTGYEDGTENPEGKEAEDIAFLDHSDPCLHGSSFLALQQWQHDYSKFDQMSQSETDDVIGRRLLNNEEFDEAPVSAHVKRTAQESFSPEAFMLRRSMPWIDGNASGLMFSAFARSSYAFEAQMNRMVGAEDGVIDGLFTFSKPLTGSYFWCPPMGGSGLELGALIA